MNLRMGSQAFLGVAIPLLWGTRAVVQDPKGRLSVIDLSGDKSRLEVLGNEPAPGVEFEPTVNGFTVLSNDEPLYHFVPSEGLLQPIGLDLPECQISGTATRVGSNLFSGNIVAGAGVGIAVSEGGISIGAPIPRGLARLEV